ncbi:unnamed protein product [Peniophora sp. CBMAI 1063]|nr:unnamed protein product [Peniophora sp. CBMAI 1063]
MSDAWDGAQDASAVTGLLEAALAFSSSAVAAVVGRKIYVCVNSRADASDVYPVLLKIKEHLHYLSEDDKKEMDAAKDPGMLSIKELLRRFTTEMQKYAYYEIQCSETKYWDRVFEAQATQIRDDVQTLLKDVLSTTGSPARKRAIEERLRREAADRAAGASPADSVATHYIAEAGPVLELDNLPLPATTSGTEPSRVTLWPRISLSAFTWIGDAIRQMPTTIA